ncbi:hypothetical protein EBZ80_25560 [bacterium]|nr:hypothetical protein [bacterium]
MVAHGLLELVGQQEAGLGHAVVGREVGQREAHAGRAVHDVQRKDIHHLAGGQALLLLVGDLRGVGRRPVEVAAHAPGRAAEAVVHAEVAGGARLLVDEVVGAAHLLDLAVEHGQVGAIVDSVSGVVDFAEGQIEPAPALGGDAGRSFVVGMGKMDGKVCVIVDVVRALGRDSLAAVEAASGSGLLAS